jgi:SAM-dependent methyltransferase
MRPENLGYQFDRTVQAIRRRRLAPVVDRIYREIVDSVDRQAFIERFRSRWNPFPSLGAEKFLDLDVWLREAVYRYFFLGVDAMGPGLRVLDLGAGTGYFLLVCRHFGHEVLGLDLDAEPLYNEAFQFFDLPRVVHRIQPLQPLADLPGRFDLVTAFMTTFHWYEDETPWPAEPWRYFLEDLRPRLSDGGRLAIKFNLNPRSGEFYSAEVRQAIKQCRLFRVKFFMDHAFLDAV